MKSISNPKWSLRMGGTRVPRIEPVDVIRCPDKARYTHTYTLGKKTLKIVFL